MITVTISWPVLQMIMSIMRPSIFTSEFSFDLLVAGFRIGGQGMKGEKKQQ